LSFLDRAVETLAGLLDALGMNGTRLRWRWNQRRRAMGEQGMRAELVWRSARTPHKMCPSCRALVPRAARRCTECGESLRGVRGPGLTRALSNLLPGISAATSLLVLVNGVLYLLMVMAPGYAIEGEPVTGAARLWGLDVGTLLRFGAGYGEWTFQLGHWWRLVTPIFLHGGLLHLLMNTYALLQLGPVAEAEYGRDRFVVVYVASGVGGFFASQIFGTLTVGASASLSGLMGLLLVYAYRHHGGSAFKQVMLQNTFLLLIMSFAFPVVDWRAHLGGLLTGAALAFVVPPGNLRSRGAERAWAVAALACVLLVLVAFWQVAVHPL
jgi:rhomboid protease GluP